MNFPIVPEYRTDLQNVNPDNEILAEPFAMAPGIFTRIVVPRHAPFFSKSLKVYNGNMEPLVAAKGDAPGDYRIYRIMGGLTELTGQSVACFIEFTNPDITSGFIDYDVVGEFSLFDNAFLQMVLNLANDDRPAWWQYMTGKPSYFRPKLHGHSMLYEMIAFKDMLDLFSSLLGLMEANARTAVEAKFEHYLDLVTHYLGVYKTEMLGFLNRHKNAYDSHGLTATQIGLPLVDNYPTARGDAILQPRDDMHLTPGGIKTIIDTYGFNSEELLGVNQLPVSQFGNSNFIPPSIDGSFEGIGGKSESAGICLESDGSLVFLENRFDGRVEGLYYSVIQTPFNNAKRLYTGYRYTHQLLEADNAIPDLIASGSGGEVILVCDSKQQLFYVGLTNGSLDSAKHVYSRLNVDALKAKFPGAVNIAAWMPYINVVLIGDWIYIVMASTYDSDKTIPYQTGFNFRYLFRVPKASVAAQLPVSAAAVNVSFKDGEGVQYMNSPVWKWGTPIPKPNGAVNEWYKWYFPFVQTENVSCTGCYRSQLTFACPIPSKPGKFLLRFAGAFWSRYVIPGKTTGYELMIEMVYEFDPATNVMTLLHQTPRYTLDFENLPSIGPVNFNGMVFQDNQQGAVVLEDGTVACSTGTYQSFPRGFALYTPGNAKTRYDTMRLQWNTQLTNVILAAGWESIVSPLKSSIKPRSFLLGNGGEFYTAADPDTLAYNRLYYRNNPGKLAKRSDVTNVLYPNMLSRPLTNDVREVNGPPYIGGASVTVPAAQLDTFGTDLGMSTFCVGMQKKYFDPTLYPGEWVAGANPDDIKLISGHTRQIEADGTITVVPTSTILYPEAIVNLLKREVDDVASMLLSPKVLVTISDPTGDLTNKFGWLPVLVIINWGKVGTTERRWTVLSIQPTYSGTTNKTVTGYTVLDKVHNSHPTGATNLTATTWDAQVWGNAPNSTHGAMRAGYHVSGNVISGFIDSGVYASGPGDGLMTFGLFTYNDKTTRRWSAGSAGITGQSGGGNHRCVVPDDGVVLALAHAGSTGGAGTMFAGANKVVLYGSVYPEVGWTVFFKSDIKVAFNGQAYDMSPGSMDLRDIDSSPQNKTFYVYAVLLNGVPTYEIGLEKRLESPFQLWVAKIVTGPTQILTIERFNVFAINGNRVSELKRGNSIPASSGLANTEGQLPWLRDDELLP